MVLPRAQQEANGWVVAFGMLVLAIPVHIGVELAEVLVAELVGLELDEYMALEHAVIEDEIDEEELVADADALLPRFEAEA